MAFKNSYVDNGGTTTGYDPTLVVPANCLEGDFMVALLQTSDNNPAIPPTPPTLETWTLAESASMPIDGTAATSNSAVWIYYKVASAADEAGAGSRSYQWVFSGSEEQCGALILLDPGEWGQFAKNEITGNQTSIAAPSVTTTTANEVVYHCALKDGGVVFTGFPSGDATRFNEIFGATSGAGAAMGVVEETYESAGATGAKTFTLTSEEANGYTFSIEQVPLTEYEISGITKDKNGDALGSCHCFLFKDNGDDTLSFIDYQLSNASTGAYAFTIYDNDAAYLVYSFKNDTPHVFDVTDHVLQGIEV